LNKNVKEKKPFQMNFINVLIRSNLFFDGAKENYNKHPCNTVQTTVMVKSY